MVMVMMSFCLSPYLRETASFQSKLAFSQPAKLSFAVASKQSYGGCLLLLLLARRAIACLLLACHEAS